VTAEKGTDAHYARLRRKAVERSRKRREQQGHGGQLTVMAPCIGCGRPVHVTSWSADLALCVFCETGTPRPA
jgi:hypothetical protein